MTPAPALERGPRHALEFSVPAPWIARCTRCGRRLKHLAEVAAACPGPASEEKSP